MTTIQMSDMMKAEPVDEVNYRMTGRDARHDRSLEEESKDVLTCV